MKMREVTLEDFASMPASAATAPAATATAPMAAAATSPETAATVPTTQPIVPLVATGSAPRRRPLKVGEPVVIDSVIGQVAGRPLFANQFLSTTGLNDRFRAMSEQLDSVRFANGAAEAIISPLQQEVLDDLFLAEAQASLTEQQKIGLLAFMQRLREDVIGRGRGSELFTQSELAEKGMTLDQYLELERDRTLISSLIREKIISRVVVSWADVEREYQKRYAEFNPPASVTLLRLRIPVDQAAKVDEVKAKLAAGESYESVSAAIGPPAAGELGTFKMGPGGISDIEVNPEYQAKLVGLTVGQTTEPVVVGTNTVWLHVQSIDQPSGKSLYDVQRQLIRQLQDERFTEERARYIKSLFEKGIYTAMPEMSHRVLTVVLMRYSP